MKLLYVVNIGRRIGTFSHSSMLAAIKLGIEFHIAGNWSGYDDPEIKREDEAKYGIKIHQIDSIRTPYDLRNVKAYRQLCSLIKRERYDIIHCNTPTGGLLGRLAGEKCKVPTVIYQPHGYHFWKGAPLHNWLIYYTIEKWLARFTDILITINQEDYALAKKKMKLKKDGKVYYVPGVGIDLSQYGTESPDRSEILEALHIKKDSFILISMGDLIKRKNYRTAIKAIALTGNRQIHYLICGTGPEEENLKKLAKTCGVEDQIHFLGYRTDVKELLSATDVFLFTSLQEGLPRSTMEAMASGLPVICSRIRGNTDLLEDKVNGYLCDPADAKEFSECIMRLYESEPLRKSMGETNKHAIESFVLDCAEAELTNIYEKLRGGVNAARRSIFIRRLWNIRENDVLLISAGELNTNKNHATIIRSLGLLRNDSIHYLVCGKGEKLQELQRLAKETGVEKQVHFAGYRTDIIDFLRAGDIFVAPSLREGMPRAVMEAMACALPCIASDIRGNRDLLADGEGGILCESKDEYEFANAIRKFVDDRQLRMKTGIRNYQKIKQFDLNRIIGKMEQIYMTIGW